MVLVPRPLSPILLFGLVPVAAWFVVRPLLDPVPPLPALYTSVGFSILAFLSTLYLVPALGPTFVKANLSGKDLLKIDKTPMFVHCLIVIDRPTYSNIDPRVKGLSARRYIYLY